jgi:hypothetical protein
MSIYICQESELFARPFISRVYKVLKLVAGKVVTCDGASLGGALRRKTFGARVRDLPIKLSRSKLIEGYYFSPETVSNENPWLRR